MTAPVCPQCKEPGQTHANDTEPVRHCPTCKLPLVIVANKYKIEHILSEGGCGILYLSKHIKLQMDPIRVIKFIKPELCENENTIKRLAREVEVTAALSQRSHHIVRVFDDFDHIDSMGSYYVMEYLEGEDLADLLDHSPMLSYRKIFHIFTQVCEAIRDAHEAEIIHRDLKPQNVYLTQRGDDQLYVKVIDFGIAKTLSAPDQTKLTKGALGTPEYMAPEQCRGHEITPGTDIYALGIILYEMIVGHTPFLPPTIRNPNPTEIALSHVMKDPPLPTEMTGRDIPNELEAIVMKCLRKKPEERFHSAGELLAALAPLHAMLKEHGTFAKNIGHTDPGTPPPVQTHMDEDDEDEGHTSIQSSASLLEPWNKGLPTAEAAEPLSDVRESPVIQGPPSSKAPPDQPPITYTEELQPSGAKATHFVLIAVVIALIGAGGWYTLNRKGEPSPTPHKQRIPSKAQPRKATAPPITRKATTPSVPRTKSLPAPTVRRRSRPGPRPKRRRYRPRKRRRAVPRRAPVPVPRVVKKNTAAPGCPTDKPGLHWVRVDIFPSGTRMGNRKYNRQRYQGRFMCFQKPANQAVGPIQFTKAGYAMCIVMKMSANKRRFRVKLIPQNDDISPDNDYCIK